MYATLLPQEFARIVRLCFVVAIYKNNGLERRGGSGAAGD